MIVEACLPWAPLPAHYSGNWQVDVVHLAESYGDDTRPGENLAIAVAAYPEPEETTTDEVAAWRLDFRACQAYRKRIINYAGSRPLTRPDASTAFWEIAPSAYLVRSGVGAAYPTYEYHHYVIVAGITEVYEILAQGWRCTPLPQEWAKPFSGGPFPRW
jgi:hypothetical protein